MSAYASRIIVPAALFLINKNLPHPQLCISYRKRSEIIEIHRINQCLHDKYLWHIERERPITNYVSFRLTNWFYYLWSTNHRGACHPLLSRRQSKCAQIHTTERSTCTSDCLLRPYPHTATVTNGITTTGNVYRNDSQPDVRNVKRCEKENSFIDNTFIATGHNTASCSYSHAAWAPNGEVSARNAFDAKQGAKTKERRKRKTTMEHERKSTERRRNFSNKECFEVWKSIANVSIWSLVGSLEFETHLFVASQMLWWPDIRRCSFAWQDHKQWLWFCIHQLTDA